MTVLALLLALVALVLFAIAAFDRQALNAARPVVLVPLGLAFLTASLICQFCGFGGERIGA